MKFLLALTALFTSVAAQAAGGVSLANEILVERVVTQPDGTSSVTREEPGVVMPGDRLVFFLRYRNVGAEPATGLVLTNPIPEAVAFAGTDDAGALLSVDGGETWGQLSSLAVAQADGTSRPAEPADVTHIRWSLAQPVAGGSGGELSFRGIVK